MTDHLVCDVALQALWHGSLLAWLSASRLQQLPFLAPTADAAVTTATTASPVFKWQHAPNNSRAASAANGLDSKNLSRVVSGAVGGASRSAVELQQLQGHQLVQHLISCTMLDTPHSRCCAASFWAGYVGCVKTSMQQWHAGRVHTLSALCSVMLVGLSAVKHAAVLGKCPCTTHLNRLDICSM